MLDNLKTLFQSLIELFKKTPKFSFDEEYFNFQNTEEIESLKNHLKNNSVEHYNVTSTGDVNNPDLSINKTVYKNLWNYMFDGVSESSASISDYFVDPKFSYERYKKGDTLTSFRNMRKMKEEYDKCKIDVSDTFPAPFDYFNSLFNSSKELPGCEFLGSNRKSTFSNYNDDLLLFSLVGNYDSLNKSDMNDQFNYFLQRVYRTIESQRDSEIFYEADSILSKMKTLLLKQKNELESTAIEAINEKIKKVSKIRAEIERKYNLDYSNIPNDCFIYETYNELKAELKEDGFSKPYSANKAKLYLFMKKLSGFFNDSGLNGDLVTNYTTFTSYCSATKTNYNLFISNLKRSGLFY